MKGDKIHYRGGYKYQLDFSYSVRTPICPTKDVHCEFVSLTRDGLLTVEEGYAWDGASGPTIDTASSMRGSLVHDALYQLMRQNLLPHTCRPAADDMLFNLCVEDGMFRWRAWLWRKMVGEFADPASRHENDNPVEIAP